MNAYSLGDKMGEEVSAVVWRSSDCEHQHGKLPFQLYIACISYQCSINFFLFLHRRPTRTFPKICPFHNPVISSKYRLPANVWVLEMQRRWTLLPQLSSWILPHLSNNNSPLSLSCNQQRTNSKQGYKADPSRVLSCHQILLFYQHCSQDLCWWCCPSGDRRWSSSEEYF